MVLRFRDDGDCMSSVLRIVLTLGEGAVDDKGGWTDWLLSRGMEDGAFVVGLKMLWLVRHGVGEERVYKWCEGAVVKTDDLRVISVACSVVVKCLQVSREMVGHPEHVLISHPLTHYARAGGPCPAAQGEAVGEAHARVWTYDGPGAAP